MGRIGLYVGVLCIEWGRIGVLYVLGWGFFRCWDSRGGVIYG